MAKFLLRGSYTQAGVKGLQKEGGTGRRTAVKELLEKSGGRLEAFYFVLGEDDVIVIADLPDAATAVAISLAVNAAAAVSLRTTVLLTAEEMDAAAKQSVPYRAPGT